MVLGEGYYAFRYLLEGEGDFLDRLVSLAGGLILFGIVAIAGGGFTLVRRIWALSLAGAIAELIMSFLFIFERHILFVVPPVVAIILTILSRKQFEK